MQFLGLDAPLKVMQVTSSLPGEGKTTTATNLAVVLAQAGHEVVLVDADLRRPRVHEVFSVPPVPGSPRRCSASRSTWWSTTSTEHLHVVPPGTCRRTRAR